MPVEIKTAVTIKCASPKCSTVLSWIEQEPETQPDAAYRCLIIQRFTGEKETVCSKACLFDYMENSVPAKSPREVTAEAQKASTAPTGTPDGKLIPFPVGATPMGPGLAEAVNAS